MRRRFPLTLRGIGAIALALGCFVLAHELGSMELMYFGCLLLALVAACVVVLHMGQRAGEVVRSLNPEAVGVGATAHVRIDLTVRSVLPLTSARWADRLPDGLAGSASGDLPPIASSFGRSGGAVHVTYAVRGIHRGHHEVGPASVQLTDPFGIAHSTRQLGGRSAVLVVPAIVDLDSIGDYTGDLGGALHSASDQLGQGADNLIARPYVPGDSMRRIHWRATAHHNELMVRQEERESTPEATVVLDRSVRRWSPAAQRRTGADPNLETALTAFVSIVRRLARDGYLVTVLDGDGTPLVPPIAGDDAHTELAELLRVSALLTAVPDDQLPALVPLFTGVAAGPVVIVTGAVGAEDLPVLRPLAHHSALPVLLSATDGQTADDDARWDELRRIGWHTGRLFADGDLDVVWREVVGRGVARVHR